MTEDHKRIVPFGKYKGQPVKHMLQDESYMQWLLAQDWFRQRFQPLYTVVINHGHEPAETPEHNRLQARCLDDGFCLALARNIAPRQFDIQAQESDVVWQSVKQAFNLTEECPITVEDRRFEDRGWDVTYRVTGGRYYERDRNQYDYWNTFKHIGPEFRAFVETKPIVGDDYPAVLRQILSLSTKHHDDCGLRVCLIAHYSGVGATLDQVRQMFAASGIRIVMLEEVEAELATAAVIRALSVPEEDT